nr:glycoside hydrolase family 88 protein [Sunxiuqinia sp.]
MNRVKINRNIKTGSTFLFFLLYINTLVAQTSSSIIEKVADNIIENTSYKIVNKKTKELYSNSYNLPLSPDYKVESPYNQWEYWNGVLAIAMIRLSEVTGDMKYQQYALNNYKFIFDNLEYFGKQYEANYKWTSYHQYFRLSKLDDCGAMAAGLCDVWQYDKDIRYMPYLDRAANYILNDEKRLDDSTFVRDFPREMTLWADDLYMSVPFLARMYKITNDFKYLDIAIAQVKNFRKYLYNENNGLYYHCWYNDNQQNGVAHWGRCNGWVIMAEVELLKLMPEEHPDKKKIIEILEDQIIGISRHQDYTGMWHQLINRADSYLESSATAMFVYGIATAVNNGWIDPSYASIAQNGWDGLCKKITETGEVEDICVGTGIKDNIRFYYDRPAKLNDIHGLGAVILAGSEIYLMEKLLKEQ